MMDGRVGSIRGALDTEGRLDTAILAYSAKFASAFFGTALQSMLDESGPHGTHAYMKAEFLDEMSDEAIEKLIAHGHNRPGPLVNLLLEPMGGAISRVGVPQYADGPVGRVLFGRNVTLTGGVAPARAYIEELLPDVLSGAVQPGRVFDRTMPLAEIPDAYRAMNDRQALKVLIKP